MPIQCRKHSYNMSCCSEVSYSLEDCSRFRECWRVATAELRRADQSSSSGRAPGTIRFTAGASLCAIVVPVSVLLDNPKPSVRWKEIKAVPVRNLQGLILFVSDRATESDIGALLALIATQSPDSTPPDWIAIPASRETSQNAPAGNSGYGARWCGGDSG